MKKPLSTTALSLLLAATVILNGAHAKDLVSTNSQLDNHAAGIKIVADLHPHIDKQTNKMAQDTPQLDGRSLRLRDYKRIQLNALRNWLDTWREQFALFLS